MKRLEPGMQVLEVNDRRIGHVRSIRDCCFEVTAIDTNEVFELVPRVVFTVGVDRVSLVCDRSGLSRYRCPAHSSSEVGLAEPRSA